MKKIMELLQNMKAKNEKKDNKGFSLVELIIVIAIMAILVGVVGTQVSPYIEKSRKAKDIQILSELWTDAVTGYCSNASTLDASVTYKITIDKTNALSVTGGGTDDNKVLLDAFKELNSVDKTADLKLESKAGKDISKIEISCQNTGDMVTLHVTNTTADYSFEDIKSK